MLHQLPEIHRSRSATSRVGSTRCARGRASARVVDAKDRKRRGLRQPWDHADF